MTFTQITYFIEAARCLNFTEAAARLFVTQPTLSRQITAIETELNMQLFIRTNKTLRLTPAGQVLFKEFSDLMNIYEGGIKKAREATEGMTGQLNIGVIDGLDISPILPGLIEFLETDYPNVKIHLERLSFRSLIQQAYDGKLDIIITYDFDMAQRPGLKFMPVLTLKPIMAIPKRHPLAQKDQLTLTDFKNETLVIVNSNECGLGVNLVAKACEDYGGYYPHFHFVDSMEDAILWVEAGVRLALLNTGMNIMSSKSIHIVPMEQLPPMHAVIAWAPQNSNPILPIILEQIKRMAIA